MRVREAALCGLTILGLAGCGAAPLTTALPDARPQAAAPAAPPQASSDSGAAASSNSGAASPAASSNSGAASPVASSNSGAASPVPSSDSGAGFQPAGAQSAPAPAVAPTPSSARIGPLQYIRQTLNNCGPASISEVLGYWGVQRSQEQSQAVLRPDGNSRGMMPYPVPAYVKSANMNVVMGVNGTPAIVKALVANSFPVIVAQLVSLQEPIAHYREVEGFDDQRQVFVSTDSYLGPNHEVSYAEFSQLWARGNQRFMVVYPPAKQDLVTAVLKSAGWDKTSAYQADLTKLQRGDNPMQQEPRANFPNIPGSRELNFAWDYIQLGQIDQAKAQIAQAPVNSRNQQMIGWLNQAISVYAA